ncbi:hypothetical protein B0H13DRAFT_1883310 [Mycena leptocephala]|nr:hypothetical protein B0H13DRAFT_1883310 [Mycena leptocephala]
MSKSGDYVSQATALGPLLLLDFADRHWAYDHSNHNPQSLNHRLLIMNKEPYNGNFSWIEMRTKVSSFIFNHHLNSHFEDVPSRKREVTTSMPQVLGIDEGAGTTSGPPADTDEADNSKPMFARNTGASSGEAESKHISTCHWQDRGGHAPVDDCVTAEPIVRRSSEPELRCTTSWGAEFRTRLSQSKSSSKSYGREAFTGISCKHTEKTPASHGSVRGPESWDARVRSPEVRTQSSEAQERAARLSKPVDTGKLQKVAAGDMRGESKGLCAGKETRMFHDVISARKVPRQRILLIKHLLTDAYLTGKKNLYLMFLVHVTVLSDATKGIVTVTSGSLGNATNPSVTVMVASVHSLTVLGRYPLQK